MMKLTRKNVWDMEAGREMDKLVARIIMGDSNENYFVTEWENGPFCYDMDGNEVMWRPSTDISAAWEVVEKMRTEHQRFITIYDNPHLNYDVRFDGMKEYERLSSLPHAICRAALTAILPE